jgi:hypothetical protein
VDVPMACGTGVCMGCVLPVTGNDGITRIVRSCVDGPIFRGDLVRWDDMNTIPFDALGAPGWSGPPSPPRPPGPLGAPGGHGGAGSPPVTGGLGGILPPGQQAQHA